METNEKLSVEELLVIRKCRQSPAAIDLGQFSDPEKVTGKSYSDLNLSIRPWPDLIIF
jgi:hypothetical protein